MLLYLLNLYALIFALFKKVDAMVGLYLRVKTSKIKVLRSAYTFDFTLCHCIFKTATLEVFRPNTTLAPSTTMMTPASTFPTENWISPFNSTQKDEFAIYGDVLSAVFDDLGLSFLSNQIWPLNISCFAVRIYCDTKEPIKFMNFSTTPMPYVTTTTTTSHPQWDYDEDEVPSLKGMMEASFLSLTPTPISNLSEMMSGNLSLPKLVNQTIAHVLPVLLSKSNLSLMTKSLPIPEIEISKAEPLSSGGELYPTSLSPWQEDRIDKRLSTITPSYKRNDNKRGRHRNRISRHSSTPGPPSARERGTTARPIAPLPYMTPTDEGPLRFTREVHSGLHIDNGTDWSSTSWSAGANDAISNKNYKSSTMPVWLWNDTDFLNDSPYSTVNPSYAESYDEYLTIEDDYCIAIKCLNIALTSSNITIYTYEDHLINGSGWLIEYSTTQSADLPDTSTSYVQSSTEKSPHELNGTKATPSDQGMNITARKLRALCWETMFGQVCSLVHYMLFSRNPIVSLLALRINNL